MIRLRLLSFAGALLLFACEGSPPVGPVSPTAGLEMAAQGPIQLTNDPANQVHAAIREGRVVWLEEQVSGPPRLVALDLDTGILTFGPPASHPDAGEILAFSGTKVVWIQHPDAGVRFWDVESQESGLISDGPGREAAPRVDGDLVVWSDSRHSSTFVSEVYLYDFSNPNLGAQRITNDSVDQFCPDVSNGRIVWMNQDGSIWRLDLASGGVDLLATDPDASCPLAFDGNWLAWASNSQLWPDIFLLDINTGALENLTSDPHPQFSPDVSQGFVVWRDHRNTFPDDSAFDSWDVYAFHIPRRTEMRVTPDWVYSFATAPSVWNNRVIWTDAHAGWASGKGDEDVFMSILISAGPPPGRTPPPRPGP